MESYHLRYPVRRSREKRRKNLLLTVFLLNVALITSTSWVIVAALAKPLPVLDVETFRLNKVGAENMALNWPTGVQSAVGTLDAGVLAKSETSEPPKPIASVAKVITALAVIEKKPFNLPDKGEEWIITQTDIDSYRSYLAQGGSVAPITLGQKISQYDALQGLLLPSANNLADSLARWCFGSVEAYVDYANDMTKKYGLTKTKIADASGFSENSVSTASEIIEIGQRLMAEPVLREIVVKKDAEISSTGKILNTNLLLNNKEVIGIKTGNTSAAGGCFLFAAKRLVEGNEVTLIGSVLGAANSAQAFKISQDLINTSFEGFGSRVVVKKGQKVASYKSSWGQESHVIADQDLTVFGWLGKELTPIVKLGRAEAPLESGQAVGMVHVAEQPTSFMPIITATPIMTPDKQWRIKNFLPFI